MMRIATLPAGDPVHRYDQCLVVPFAGARRVLSTSPMNGGYREDLTAVFNNDMNPGPGMACRMLAPTYGEHLTAMARELGLDPETSSGISTSASMEHVSIQTESFEALSVTAVVTGGIEVNGGRAGDPAAWYEAEQKAVPLREGTINILLFFNTDLTPGAMARALVTCTEAKTAALQELLAPSRYSMGLATGSGTDGTIVVCNAEAEICLTDAGKHSKLGELIGKAVKQAVKEALRLQTGLSGEYQHQVLRRTDRFGITEQSLWEDYRKQQGKMSRADYSDRLYTVGRRGELVTAVSLYVHLLDQLIWELLSPQETYQMGRKILGIIKGRHGEEPEQLPDREAVLERMIRELKDALNGLVEEKP